MTLFLKVNPPKQPIGACIWLKFMVNVGKYTIPMDHLGGVSPVSPLYLHLKRTAPWVVKLRGCVRPKKDLRSDQIPWENIRNCTVFLKRLNP